MSKPISTLYGTVKQPIVVIGGGPSVLEDLKKVPEDCYNIAVNMHAMGILEPDLAVWTHKEVLDVVDYKCESVSDRRGADYLFKLVRMEGCCSMSGYKAALIALELTDKEVYIVGMDCYSGEKFYLNSDRMIGGYDVDVCLRGWVWIDNKYPGRLVFSSKLFNTACERE